MRICATCFGMDGCEWWCPHRWVTCALVAVFLAGLLYPFLSAKADEIPRAAYQYRDDLVRNARFVWGLDAPVATMAGQIHQESAYRADAQSHAGAQGLAQMMPATGRWLAEIYPADLGGEAQPFNPQWAIRALVAYDERLLDRVPTAVNECEAWAMVLSQYNGGPGWFDRDRALAASHGADRNRWWGHVELYSARSRAAFTENRAYPRRIVFLLSPLYERALWGRAVTCEALSAFGSVGGHQCGSSLAGIIPSFLVPALGASTCPTQITRLVGTIVVDAIYRVSSWSWPQMLFNPLRESHEVMYPRRVDRDPSAAIARIRSTFHVETSVLDAAPEPMKLAFAASVRRLHFAGAFGCDFSLKAAARTRTASAQGAKVRDYLCSTRTTAFGPARKLPADSTWFNFAHHGKPSEYRPCLDGYTPLPVIVGAAATRRVSCAKATEQHSSHLPAYAATVESSMSLRRRRKGTRFSLCDDSKAPVDGARLGLDLFPHDCNYPPC